jgi:hypothetical protein
MDCMASSGRGRTKQQLAQYAGECVVPLVDPLVQVSLPQGSFGPHCAT